MAINNLAGYKLEMTGSASELIQKHFELSWSGCTVHFLWGLVGMALLVGAKASVLLCAAAAAASGSSRSSRRKTSTRRIGMMWAIATCLYCIGVVDRGISLGPDSAADGIIAGGDYQKSFLWLTLKYIKLVVSRSVHGFVPLAAVTLVFASLIVLLMDVLGRNTADGREGRGIEGKGIAAANNEEVESDVADLEEYEQTSRRRGIFGLGRRRNQEEEDIEILIPNWR